MNHKLLPQLVLCGAMLGAAGTSKWLTPTHLMADGRPAQSFEQMIPASFDGWTQETVAAAAIVDPQMQEELKRIYTQLLSRTYVNQAGQRVMLSLAYGRDQSDTTQVHYPEICYPAQGFQVRSNHAGVLATPNGTIPVRRLETALGEQRYEPVTYWTTVGDVAVVSRTDKKLVEMRYGFKGTIPDGLLFRVSSIERDSGKAFLLQDQFVKSLQGALAPADRLRLMGLAN